jgi:hypothetical protein
MDPVKSTYTFNESGSLLTSNAIAFYFDPYNTYIPWNDSWTIIIKYKCNGRYAFELSTYIMGDSTANSYQAMYEFGVWNSGGVYYTFTSNNNPNNYNKTSTGNIIRFTNTITNFTTSIMNDTYLMIQRLSSGIVTVNMYLVSNLTCIWSTSSDEPLTFYTLPTSIIPFMFNPSIETKGTGNLSNTIIYSCAIAPNVGSLTLNNYETFIANN